MIGLVLVTYAFWPGKLMDSVAESGIAVRWYIHHHGHAPDFAARVQALAGRADCRVHMHGENRGLSRSWNEGLKEAYDDGCDLTLLLNDDIHFIDDGFRTFIAFARAHEGYGVAFLHGLETGSSPHAGQVISQGFACCIIAKLALERIGWFDQNFTPAYYEDLDYWRRCHLSGLGAIIGDGVLVEHERSKTTRDNAEIAAQHDRTMARNRSYYVSKWGEVGKETLPVPFGNPRFTARIDWAERDDPYPGQRPSTT